MNRADRGIVVHREDGRGPIRQRHRRQGGIGARVDAERRFDFEVGIGGQPDFRDGLMIALKPPPGVEGVSGPRDDPDTAVTEIEQMAHGEVAARAIIADRRQADRAGTQRQDIGDAALC